MQSSTTYPRWPASAPPSAEGASGHGLQVDAAPPGAASRRWVMCRRGSIGPWQLLALCALPCAVALAIGSFFLGLGAPWVLVFAGLELVALAAALFIHARHVGDRESLSLQGRHLDVECVDGGRLTRARLRIDRLVVEPAAGQGSLIELSAPGTRIRIGRLLRPEQRAVLASELRHALRLALLLPASAAREPSLTHPR